jgi:hypothetical protein
MAYEKIKTMRFNLPPDQVEGKFQLFALIAAIIFPSELSLLVSGSAWDAAAVAAAKAHLSELGLSDGFAAGALEGLQQMNGDGNTRNAIALLRGKVDQFFGDFAYNAGDVCKTAQLQGLVQAARSMEAAVVAQIAFENGQ